MKFSFKRILFTAILLPLMSIATYAQSDISFYQYEDLFNSSNFNPAFLTSQRKISISIFPFGGTSIGYNNQEIIRKLVTKSLSGLTTDEDYMEVLRTMVNRSSFNQKIESTLLSITFPSKSGYFDFRIKENQNFTAHAQGILTGFIFEPDVQSVGINQIQSLPAQAMHYREFSLGYSPALKNTNFTYGIRAKLYFGKAIFSSGLSGSIQKYADEYAFVTNGLVKLSAPDVKGRVNNISLFNGSGTSSYIMNSGNPGLGVDLGFKYRITADLSLSMSVLDLGKISWKTNLNSKNFDLNIPLTKYVTESASDLGLPIITKIPNTKISNINDSIVATVQELFHPSFDSTAFSETLPVTLFAGIKYRINPSLKISLVDKYIYLKNLSYNSISLLANFDLNDKITVGTGYSIIGNSINNIPLTFVFKRKFGQFYFGTSNVAAFIMPSVSDYAGFSFGTCFYLYKNRDFGLIDPEYLPFYRKKKNKRTNRKGLK